MWDPGIELRVIRVGSKCFHSQSNPKGHKPAFPVRYDLVICTGQCKQRCYGMILGLFCTQDSWGSIGNEVSFRVRVAPPLPQHPLDRCASKNVQSQLLRRLAWVTE